LNGVLGFAELGKRSVATCGRAGAWHHFEHIVKPRATSCSRIINDILDFSKSEAGQLEDRIGALRRSPRSSANAWLRS
jgi:signal transduction histidine kinase